METFLALTNDMTTQMTIDSEYTQESFALAEVSTEATNDVPFNWSWVPRDTLFYIIHYTAICSLSISILASIGTLIYQQKSTSTKYFWRRKLGERLEVYLAITDLVYSVSHTCDHILSLIYTGIPPVIPCVIFAFSLLEMILAQNMVVFMTAISLCLLVSCNRKVSFGMYDMGLLSLAYGAPLIICIFCAAYGFFGSTGYWCLTDINKSKSLILHQILGAIQVLIAVLIILCYSFVWISISNSARRLKNFASKKGSKSTTPQLEATSQTQSAGTTPATSSTDVSTAQPPVVMKPDGTPNATVTEEDASQKKEAITENESTKMKINRHKSYTSTAKILSLFVLSYIAQWWPMISVPIWNIFASPPVEYYPVCLFFLNLGGVFNLCAYTVARRMYNKSHGNTT